MHASASLIAQRLHAANKEDSTQLMTDPQPTKRKYKRPESWGALRDLASGRYTLSLALDCFECRLPQEYRSPDQWCQQKYSDNGKI